MRTIERWNEAILPKLLLSFSPRIQKDLQTIPLDLENVPDMDKGAYIFGSVGVGKTILAVRILLSIHQSRYLKGEATSFHFVTIPDLLLEIRQCFENKEVSESAIIDKYTNVDLLILDDLGVEKTSDWVLQTLYLIINQRYENLKPTIFTSNLSLIDLRNKLGDERISSRVYAMSKQIVVKGFDKRIKTK